MRLQVLVKYSDGIVKKYGVGIEQKQTFAFSTFGRFVVGSAKPQVLDKFNQTKSVIATEQSLLFFIRTIVCHDDFISYAFYFTTDGADAIKQQL
jgi:hypothetical protein